MFSYQLIANDAPLEIVQTFRYLGVVVDENLSWKSHLEKMQGKVLQRLSILRILKHLLPRRARSLFVNTMIISILEYRSLAWGDKEIRNLVGNGVRNLVPVEDFLDLTVILDEETGHLSCLSSFKLGVFRFSQILQILIESFYFLIQYFLYFM